MREIGTAKQRVPKQVGGIVMQGQYETISAKCEYNFDNNMFTYNDKTEYMSLADYTSTKKQTIKNFKEKCFQLEFNTVT